MEACSDVPSKPKGKKKKKNLYTPKRPSLPTSILGTAHMGSPSRVLHALLAARRAAATFDLGFLVSAVLARHFFCLSRRLRPVVFVA